MPNIEPLSAKLPGWRLAAPSWVIPGTIAKNALFLQGRVPEVGLCLFEWRTSLAYGHSDLPAWLAKLNLQWHVHLPLDLPWREGASTAANICLELLGKIHWLEPKALVLHPPANSGTCKKKLAQFAQIWAKSSSRQLLLENTRDCDIFCLGKDFLDEYNYSFCLDLGHALRYSQFRLLEPDFTQNACMIHWNVPGEGRHLGLGHLAGEQRAIAVNIIRMAKPDVSHMLEMFDWDQIVQSIPVLAELRAKAHKEGAIK